VIARLYLDEDVSTELARALRRSGADAISVHEIGAAGLSDAEQLQRAAETGRALLTYNYADFLALGAEWFLANRSHAGIIVSYHQYDLTQVGVARRAVLRLLNGINSEQLRDTIQVLDAWRPLAE
jgi:hypothetical protein